MADRPARDAAPLGLLGGTFDPIHVGHLRLALEVREAAALGTVRLLPAPAPRLRGEPRVSAADRLRLVEAAVDGVDGLVADGRELAASGPTRTVETLSALREEEPDRALCWIMGADAVTRLDRWHRWEELPELAHLIIARRPGAALPEEGPVARLIAARRSDDPRVVHEARAGAILVCDVPGLDVSATGIRDRLARGRSVAFLVPESVRSLLIGEGMYVDG